MVTLFLSGRKMGDPHERPFGRSLTVRENGPARYFCGSRIELRTKERKANMLTPRPSNSPRSYRQTAELTNQGQGRDRITIETSPDEVRSASSPQRETLP